MNDVSIGLHPRISTCGFDIKVDELEAIVEDQKRENRMDATIWVLVLLVLLVVLYVYEKKRRQAYLAELEILDEPYMRLKEAGVLSATANNRHENQP